MAVENKSAEATPAEADETKQWEGLAAELEQPASDVPPIEKDTPPEKIALREPPADDDKGEPEPEPDKPRLTYEQLESNQRNTTEALRQERDARRRAEESLSNVHRLVDELRTARAGPPKPRAEPPKIPDVDDDPVGHFQAVAARQQAIIDELQRNSQATVGHLQAQAAEQQFWGHVQAAETEFRKTTPNVQIDGKDVSDYDLACEHLRRHRMAELVNLYPDSSAVAMAEAREMGLPTPAHMRAAILHQDAIGIAQRAFQLGVSPAQLYYEAAKGRGYATPSNGKHPRSGANLEAVKRGQKASLTIGGGEGRKSNNDMTISDLSDLFIDDPDEFDKQWEKMRAAGKLG